MFILAGVGNNIDEIPLGVIEYLKRVDFVFIEYYTNIFPKDIYEYLIKIRNDIKIVYRDFVENQLEEFILKNNDKNIMLIVGGSPNFATTHVSLIDFCRKNGIKYKIINAPSVFDEIGKIGISIYKFGIIISIPFHESESFYFNIEKNRKNGYHSLLLLDIDIKNNRYLTFKEAIERILKLEEKYKKNVLSLDDYIIVCSNLGREKEKIIYGKLKDLINIELDPPICIIIPGNLNRIEEEFLNNYKYGSGGI